MSHPLVQAANPVVADLLAATLEILRDAGGYISPTTRLIERDGQLSIESIAEDGSPMLRIPRECFVRVDRVTWAEQDSRMVIVEVPEEFTDIETELLYVQVALHNACGKLAWMERTHPSLDSDLSDELIEAVRELIPSFRNPQMAATDVLWANRCFRLALEPEAPPERALLPVLDLLNHHADGAVADWTGEEFVVSAVKPFGTNEVALNYGMKRDPLEMAVVYGFADTSAPQHARHDYPPETLARIRDLARIESSKPASAALLRAACVLLEME